MPSPRILSTHMPYSILPDSIISSDCKIIYTSRDPKDVSVSQYYYICDRMNDHETPFVEMFDEFCAGRSNFGPVWDHVLGYWQESLKKPENVLFFKYEEMLKEPVNHLKRLAEFIRCPFSETEQKQGVLERIIELCSFQKLKNLEVNKTGKWNFLGENYSNSAYFRKGSVGDWRNHMTPEMAQKINDITNAKFKGSKLEIDYTDESKPTSTCME